MAHSSRERMTRRPCKLRLSMIFAPPGTSLPRPGSAGADFGSIFHRELVYTVFGLTRRYRSCPGWAIVHLHFTSSPSCPDGVGNLSETPGTPSIFSRLRSRSWALLSLLAVIFAAITRKRRANRHSSPPL